MEAASDEHNEELPKINEIITGEKTHRKYKLVSVLGTGGYGTVFEAAHENKKYAIKVEKYTQSMLNIETSVLKVAKLQKCDKIVEFIEAGQHKPHYCYLIMPLLGKDLHTLRSERKERKFSASTVTRLAIQSLQAVQELHEKCEYISRDVKPGNFVIGSGSSERRLFLIDFGLARKYLDQNHNIIPSRKDVGWRGTTRYGSLTAHLKKDLSRKDDVESWFYMLIELTKGSVPWRLMVDREMVMSAKMSARTDTRSSFLAKCPREYDEILTHIDSLAFPDAPNYEKITALLYGIMKQHGFSWEQHFDWEDEIQIKKSGIASSDAECQKANKDISKERPVREN